MSRWQVIGWAIVIVVVASAIPRIGLLVAILFGGVLFVAFSKSVNRG